MQTDHHRHSKADTNGDAGGLKSYNAILRHRDLLGDDPDAEPISVPGLFRFQDLSRIVAGFAMAAMILPAVYLLWTLNTPNFLPIAGLVALTGMLGVYAGHRLTVDRLGAWARQLSRRTNSLVGTSIPPDLANPDSVVSYLEYVTRSLETRLEGQLRSERDAFISTITSLVSALEARDACTRNHSVNVAKLSVRIGNRMGLPPNMLYEIHLGGLLHDVGKIGIRDDILLKPAGLSREEYEIMKTHPELGARILSGLPGLEPVARIVLHHHEMFDGRGYPDGLSGDDIPLGARIVAVADTYLSLVEDRPYRQGRTLERTRNELRRVAGRQHDPGVIDALFDLMEEEHRQGRGLFVAYEADPDDESPEAEEKAA